MARICCGATPTSLQWFLVVLCMMAACYGPARAQTDFRGGPGENRDLRAKVDLECVQAKRFLANHYSYSKFYSSKDIDEMDCGAAKIVARAQGWKSADDLARERERQRQDQEREQQRQKLRREREQQQRALEREWEAGQRQFERGQAEWQRRFEQDRARAQREAHEQAARSDRFWAEHNRRMKEIWRPAEPRRDLGTGRADPGTIEGIRQQIQALDRIALDALAEGDRARAWAATESAHRARDALNKLESAEYDLPRADPYADYPDLFRIDAGDRDPPDLFAEPGAGDYPDLFAEPEGQGAAGRSYPDLFDTRPETDSRDARPRGVGSGAPQRPAGPTPEELEAERVRSVYERAFGGSEAPPDWRSSIDEFSRDFGLEREEAGWEDLVEELGRGPGTAESSDAGYTRFDDNESGDVGVRGRAGGGDVASGGYDRFDSPNRDARPGQAEGQRGDRRTSGGGYDRFDRKPASASGSPFDEWDAWVRNLGSGGSAGDDGTDGGFTPNLPPELMMSGPAKVLPVAAPSASPDRVYAEILSGEAGDRLAWAPDAGPGNASKPYTLDTSTMRVAEIHMSTNAPQILYVNAGIVVADDGERGEYRWYTKATGLKTHRTAKELIEKNRVLLMSASGVAPAGGVSEAKGRAGLRDQFISAGDVVGEILSGGPSSFTPVKLYVDGCPVEWYNAKP